MAKRQIHVHKLKRHKYPTGNAVYFCILPDCHFKIEVALALGKRTLCNTCGEEFIINEYTLKLARPHCDGCGKVKVKDSSGEVRYVKKVANKILAGVAENTTDSLRNRLNNMTSTEEDI